MFAAALSKLTGKGKAAASTGEHVEEHKHPDEVKQQDDGEHKQEQQQTQTQTQAHRDLQHQQQVDLEERKLQPATITAPSTSSQSVPALYPTVHATDDPPPSYEEAIAASHPQSLTAASVALPVAHSAALPSNLAPPVYIVGRSNSAPPSPSPSPSPSVAPVPVPVIPVSAEQKVPIYYADPIPVCQPVAVPPQTDPLPSFTSRLMVGAAAAIAMVQSTPHYQAAHAHVVKFKTKHLPPEIIEFMKAPTLGKLLLHPQYLFMIYSLYAAIKAPFTGVIKSIIISAAKRALHHEKVKEAHTTAVTHATNAAVRHGLKAVIGSDMNVNLSPEVCRAIVENVDSSDLAKLFSFFTRTRV